MSAHPADRAPDGAPDVPPGCTDAGPGGDAAPAALPANRPNRPLPPVAPDAGVIDDPWPALRNFTPARLALGRAGHSLPTDAVLRFGVAHAQARDAVHHPLDATSLIERARLAGFETVVVHSAATDRRQYLARPDLGRQLEPDSRARLAALAAGGAGVAGIVFVLADGLSSVAVERHALPVLEAFCALAGDGEPRAADHDAAGDRHPGAAEVAAAAPPFRPPLVIAQEARVALGDDIGQALAAQLVVVLIGERPGLSSPDSLGVYVTFEPRVGRTDAERNCISNIRPAGLPYTDAARELQRLLARIRIARCSGVHLEDRTPHAGLPLAGDPPGPASDHP